MDINELTEPGIHSVPASHKTISPVPDGYAEYRDMGNYRLLKLTDKEGAVTNWMKKRPDGEWVKVQGVTPWHLDWPTP